MSSFDFEGRSIRIHGGDTIASALYRAGVRTFTRSLKYHRRRGLYCMSGDCPNCLLTVDGQPGTRACATDARAGQRVRREAGWPSADRDVLAIADRAHRVLPVGFYYKTFIRPSFAWPLAERLLRRVTGVGRLPVGAPVARTPTRAMHVDVLVIGGGVAGLAAAAAASEGGADVVVCEEGRLGERLAPGPTLDRVRSLAQLLRERQSVTILERHTALGVYEGPLVPIVGGGRLLRVEPRRIVVATGAVESHPVFPGNDVPGVWLGRGAARMAGVHGVRPGGRAVVAADSPEGLEHIATLSSAGVGVVAAVVPGELIDALPPSVRLGVGDGSIEAVEGRDRVRAVRVRGRDGSHRIGCDAVVVSLGLAPRDGLLRQADEIGVTAAGDVVHPGCTVDEAVAEGARAGRGEAGRPREPRSVELGSGGYVCLCEDVSTADLAQAWSEGWRSSELLKRYTTSTMGPCQGALCGRHLARFAAARATSSSAGARTTARPPARPVALEHLAGGVHEVIEKRTALHDRHLRLGARLDWSGAWKRPFTYGDVADEHRAVRQRVGVMDVGTLGKFLIAGRDATALVDRVLPCRIRDLAPGRARYMLALDEAGYVMDDGLVCSVDGERYYLTSTSGGAERMEAWLRDWVDRWHLHVHVVDQTAMLGAILVAGPRARDLVSRLTDDDIGRETLPHLAHREVTVAGVPCRAMRVGFVGELAFELHHPRSRGGELWDALLRAGRDLGVRPHGLDTLDLLRLEKGHPFLGQDTLPDDHPDKLGLGFAVDIEKGSFIGRLALRRMAEHPLPRRLVGLTFDARPQRGAPLDAGRRIVGRVTSCAWSPSVGRFIGLGWMNAIDGGFPSVLGSGPTRATVADRPFYDPNGARLRA